MIVASALLSQSAPLLAGSATLFSFVQNVDRTQVRGVEFVIDQYDVFIPGLELMGSLTALGQDLQALDHAISSQPDATLEQLLRQSGIVCSIMAVHRAALRLDWHYKKSRCGRVSKTGPTRRMPARSGLARRPALIRAAWYSLTNPGRKRT